MRKTVAYILLLTIALILCGSGCLGFGEGYTEKAQEMTSEQYAETQYKAFIMDYNSVRQMGANIINAQTSMEEYQKQYKNPELYTSTQAENFEDLRFEESSYIQQYNLFVTKYNNRMRDVTTNQPWMKPQNYPEQLDYYIKGKPVISLNDPELVLPNTMPQAPPDWVPPQR